VKISGSGRFKLQQKVDKVNISCTRSGKAPKTAWKKPLGRIAKIEVGKKVVQRRKSLRENKISR
jgi:hypothetical protein